MNRSSSNKFFYELETFSDGTLIWYIISIENLNEIITYESTISIGNVQFNDTYEIFNLDVTKYAFPKDKNLIFMFNPFNAKVMEATFVSLFKTYDINNNYIVYINARHKDVLLDLGFKMRYFNATDSLDLFKWGIAVFETPST